VDKSLTSNLRLWTVAYET